MTFLVVLIEPTNLCRSKTSCDRPLDETVKNHVNEFTDLTDIAPDFGLNGRVHLNLFNRQRDQFVQNVSNLSCKVNTLNVKRMRMTQKMKLKSNNNTMRMIIRMINFKPSIFWIRQREVCRISSSSEARASCTPNTNVSIQSRRLRNPEMRQYEHLNVILD